MAGAPCLVVLGGLPATGKSTVAAELACRTGFTYLRIDSIEQAVIRSTALRQPLGPVGYIVGYDLAADQLRHGVSVIADCVNPLGITREAWRTVAVRHGARVLEVEVVCSSPEEHRRRAETRTVDVVGLEPPGWQSILDHEYEPWTRDRVVVDTARQSAAESAETLYAMVCGPQPED
ncbi:AAA family ATPase [Amycolatopsis umgeniensis]|uniref:Putative kinase n=1 Tax=Amycolatopsis umgeniensis TaxID=336628 RepID=A0A841BBG7_9PSEU|nr:AAA family ATPase [Amycolatopsis umgeniensis]MBB5857346.1 putative kinase [Amycolatopsis umgeniensis]